MSHRAIVLLLVFVWASAFSIPARGEAPARNAPDAAASSGQNASQSPTQGSGQNSGQQAPTKKVWTNEDLSGLREEPAISEFSIPNTKPSAPGQKPAPKGKDAKWYHGNIIKLQAKIPPLDDEIAELQAAIDGKATGNGKESTRPRGVKQDSWPAEMDNLKKQRNGVASQIDQLYDDARRDGIPASALPLQP